jgi:hypothetical protein
MILYLKHPKDSMKNLLDLINTFGNITGHKVNIQNQQFFHVPAMHILRKKSGKEFHSQQHQKIKHLGINLTKEVINFYYENY